MARQIKTLKIIALLVSIFALSACTYMSRKVPIQQGNVFTQSMVNQLKPGMSQAEVEAIMGEPILNNSLDPNRLDYVYTYRKGDKHKRQNISLLFKNNALYSVTGSMVPSEINN